MYISNPFELKDILSELNIRKNITYSDKLKTSYSQITDNYVISKCEKKIEKEVLIKKKLDNWYDLLENFYEKKLIDNEYKKEYSFIKLENKLIVFKKKKFKLNI